MDGAVPEQEKPEVVLKPRLIEDLNQQTTGTSLKMNPDGSLSALVRAKFHGGDLQCLPETTTDRVDVGFESTMTKAAVEMARDQNVDLESIPPALITDVIPANDEHGEPSDQWKMNQREIEERALQHNAFIIKMWMDRGGNVENLPDTKYKPDFERLKNGEVVKAKSEPKPETDHQPAS